MKKGIFASLLVMVLVSATMTACVKSDAQTATPESKIIGTVVEQIPTQSAPLTYAEEVFLETPLHLPIIKEMDEVEIAEYLSEAIRISKERTLSPYQIESVSYNVYYLYEFNTTEYDEAEFESQIHEIFNNVAAQVERLGFSLTSFHSWSCLPIASILCEYFSSNSNYLDYTVDCSVLEYLSDEEVLNVSKTFFENPVFTCNTAFACDVICTTSCDEAIEMAWNHIETLSNSSATALSKNTFWICTPIFMHENMYNSDRIIEICNNILANPHYNFVGKYSSILQASFRCSWNTENVGDEVFNLVLENLLKLAQTSDKETYELIVDIAIKLYDESFLNSDAIEALRGTHNIELLQKYLTEWRATVEAEYGSN